MKKNYKKWVLVLGVLVIVCVGIIVFAGLRAGESADNTGGNQQNVTGVEGTKKDDESIPEFKNDEEEQKYIEKVMQEEEVVFEDSQVQEVDENSPQKTYESEEK